MPTYTVTAPSGRLNAEQKQNLATAITRAHHDITGAPTYFAQVIFVEVQPGNYFVGGAPLAHDQIFIHGQIRAGRSEEDKRKLIEKILLVCSPAAAAPASALWVYLVDLPAAQMAEFGHILPEPGQEAQWSASLPAADRQRMEAVGKTAQ
ncbi:4-oxalocrotonate tautomerase [Desulfurispirillum indicum S5]|uniref:4-oxalocrotonate tautomerase n=1 Tax=Desulfurispirillum indicum (strain ATCC BAA-1389 / DSM 22839 / S5) TaxID=653733 RepID=E6W3C6_DESIS|nr:tautomerase family protein [Desulfurispirillum indicum]ADU66880.1 4-oxalocrotonate tautomerase [Desulfurispirillum indicum S5]